jgi:hypothetical protein
MESCPGPENLMTTNLTRAVICIIAVGLIVPLRAHAQSTSGPAGQRGAVATGVITILLSDDATLTFNPGGPYKALGPSLQAGGSVTRSASGASANPVSPPDPMRVFQPQDVEALDLAIRQSNATRCLTQMGFVCEPAPPSLAGPLRERSTRVSMVWLITQLGSEFDRDPPLPAIQIDANPNPGITGIPSWFWVDRTSYDGQTFAAMML